MHSRLRRSWCTGDTIEIPRRILSAIVHYKEVFHGKEGVAMTDFPWRARWGQRPRNLIPHTLYKRIPIELALAMSYPFFFPCYETAKHWRVKSDLWWNSWKKLEKDFKDFECTFRECINTLYTLEHEFGHEFRGIWKIIYLLLEKRKSREKSKISSRKFISVLERVLSKIYEIYTGFQQLFF